MKITESQLRSIIRSVIKESNNSSLELEHYDSINKGYIPNIKNIKSEYFRHVHSTSPSNMSPEEWASNNLNLKSYDSHITRQRVMKALQDVEMHPAHRMPSGR